MEYLAFILLGLGIFLVSAGFFLQTNREKADANIPDFTGRAGNAPVRVESSPLQEIRQLNTQPPSPMPYPLSFHEGHAGLRFENNAPVGTTPAINTDQAVGVKVSRENPKLFERFSYLYLDSSGKNTYITQGSGIDIRDVSGIRRFGRGLFSYDGFLFRFTHATGEERFPLNSLQFISFYPNCVALTPKNNLPVALLFMEETDSIRQILETFKVENGAT